MLTRIGEALGSWTPRASGGDPLTVIRSSWAQLVGADVARAAAPVAIAHDTLVVLTASAAWSHQLSFLEPQILRGIHATAPAAGIARLRFRVGAIRTKPATVKSAPRPSGPRHTSGPPRRAPATAREAFERFRAAIERSRAAHREAGGMFCSGCAAAIARGTRGGRCVPCADWIRASLETGCQRLLFDAPWLRPQEVLDMLPGLDASAYDLIRRQLLRAWRDEMVLARKRASLPRPVAPDRVRLRKIASSFVLLETKLDPHRLEMDSPVRRNALGDLYEFIRSVEQAGDASAGSATANVSRKP